MLAEWCFITENCQGTISGKTRKNDVDLSSCKKYRIPYVICINNRGDDDAGKEPRKFKHVQFPLVSLKISRKTHD